MKFSRVALLGAATLTVAEHHHVHKHAARHGSPLEVRDAATTTTVAGPTVTVYELNGDVIQWDDVQAGMQSGKYVLVGDESTSSAAQPSSTSTSATSTSSPSPIPTTSSAPAAKFIEKKPTTSATPTSTYVAPTSSSAPPPPPPAATSAAPKASVADIASDSSASSSSSSGQGLTSNFPSGKISCSDFASVSKYGAVAAPWVGLGGWTGIQHTPSYSIGAAAISYIETLIPGSSDAKSNSFYSYACPPGYQKSQWPEAQGATGQSIGGLYCNNDGKLELTSSTYKTLCMKGAGNVNVKSSLSKVVSICGTDYPGTESETIATVIQGQGSSPLNCPDAKTSYKWQGSFTSAQYYLNPSGYGPDKACVWGTPGSNLGNYAPVNIGVGKGVTGETFISIFPNHPSNMDGVLDYDVAITGGVSGKCSYTGGKYYNNGVESPTGCTVSFFCFLPRNLLNKYRSPSQVLRHLSSLRLVTLNVFFACMHGLLTQRFRLMTVKFSLAVKDTVDIWTLFFSQISTLSNSPYNLKSTDILDFWFVDNLRTCSFLCILCR